MKFVTHAKAAFKVEAVVTKVANNPDSNMKNTGEITLRYFGKIDNVDAILGCDVVAEVQVMPREEDAVYHVEYEMDDVVLLPGINEGFKYRNVRPEQDYVGPLYGVPDAPVYFCRPVPDVYATLDSRGKAVLYVMVGSITVIIAGDKNYKVTPMEHKNVSRAVWAYMCNYGYVHGVTP